MEAMGLLLYEISENLKIMLGMVMLMPFAVVGCALAVVGLIALAKRW